VKVLNPTHGQLVVFSVYSKLLQAAGGDAIFSKTAL